MKRDVLRIGLFVFLIFCFTFIFNAKTTLSQNMGVYITCMAGAENSTIHSKTEYSDSTIGTSAASRNVYESKTNGNGGSFETIQMFSAVQNTGYMEAANDTYKFGGGVNHIRTQSLIGTEGTQANGDDFVSVEQYGVGSGSFMRDGEYHTTMAGSSLEFVAQSVDLNVVGYSQVGASGHYYNYSGPTENGGSFAPTGWNSDTVTEIESESVKYRLGMHGQHYFSGTNELYSPNYSPSTP
ncbi:MAG: hypothetical protein U9R17_01520 [Thermodesulfobacteriota bacterium]|nr:hypothetical protein [Thermodesulfobacteriota bacterium]